jgi:hypothetical protein
MPAMNVRARVRTGELCAFARRGRKLTGPDIERIADQSMPPSAFRHEDVAGFRSRVSASVHEPSLCFISIPASTRPEPALFDQFRRVSVQLANCLLADSAYLEYRTNLS